ncbi:putative hemolysin [uncultured Gammaproteobacteria bacterium]
MLMSLWGDISIVVLLITASAFFSGSETALTGASRARMHQLEQEGNRRAGIVNRLREKKERVIGALLLGNSAINILASAIATGALIELIGDAGVWWATGLMTVLILIFAEVLPKTYALNFADRFSLAVAPLVQILIVILAPVTTSVDLIVRRIFKLFGVELHTHGLLSTEEELRGAIELHHAEAQEQGIREERAMLRSILDLNEVDVGRIMTHRRNLVTIDADLPAAEILDAVLDSQFTRLPVWREDSDNIVGVVHAKALLREVRACGGKMEGLDVLAIAAEPWFIPESTTLFDQLQAFRRRREHVALVVDEYGTLLGLVTLEDILEEIVGDIIDEHDINVPGVVVDAGGSYVVEGRVTIRDLNREFEWRLPDSKFSTIAGLVLNEARRIPEIGQVFTFYDFRFEILDRQRNQITSIRIFPPNINATTKRPESADALG